MEQIRWTTTCVYWNISPVWRPAPPADENRNAEAKSGKGIIENTAQEKHLLLDTLLHLEVSEYYMPPGI